jgi:hypothetical protein
MHLHRRLHLPRIVDDLADERRQPVDGQAWPPLELALADDLRWPLLAEPRETDVVARRFAVVRSASAASLKASLASTRISAFDMASSDSG